MQRYFVFPILLFHTEFALAYNVPNTGILYRVDIRSPEEIFSTGFHSFGENDSVRDHARGVSCVDRQENSAFISTSTDPEWAGNYARRLYSQTAAPVYVYIITSQSNFYNLGESLEHVNYLAGIENSRTQSDWIAHHSIPATTIQGVRTYTSSNTPAITRNPDYDERLIPEISSSAYGTPASSDADGTQQWVASLNPLVGACMAATVSCFNPKRSRSYERVLAKTCDVSEPYKINTLLFNHSYLP